VNLHLHPVLNHPEISTGYTAPRDPSSLNEVLPVTSLLPDITTIPLHDTDNRSNSLMLRLTSDDFHLSNMDGEVLDQPITHNHIWGLQPLPRNSSLLTIFYQNIKHHPDDPYTSLTMTQQEYDPDVLCLCELSINITKQAAYKLQQDYRTSFHYATLALSHTQDDFLRSKIKSGGTATIAVGPTTARVISKGSDPLGRWSWIVLIVSKSSKLGIVTVYRPCKTTVTSSGPTTYYMRLYRQHLRDGCDLKVDPRAELVFSLQTFIQSLRDHLMIVYMDANDTENHRDTTSIFDMLEENGLASAYNVVSNQYAETLPATYNRGSSCIDHVYVSTQLLPMVSSITIHRFGTGFNSDHRPITIQLDLGLIRRDLTRQGYRTVHSQKIIQAEHFRLYLSKLFQDHSITDRLDLILTAMREGCTADLIKKFESIDKKGELIAAALKRHSKHITNTAWSRRLARAGLLTRYWAERAKALRHGYTISKSWIQKAIEIGIQSNTDLTLAQIQQYHKAAVTEYQQMKATAVPLRDKFLEDLADHYAQGDNKVKAKRPRVLRRKEKLRRAYQHITGLFRGDRQPLLALLIPDGDLLRMTTDPEEINLVLLATNKSQLQASSVSPFVTGNLTTIGPDGLTEAAQLILRGQYNTSEDLSLVEQMLVTMLTQACPTMDIDLDTNEAIIERFTTAIAVTPEKTSSSPSGIN